MSVVALVGLSLFQSPWSAMLAIAFFVVLVAFAVIWYLQKRLNDAGIVDVFWSLTVASLGLFFCVVGFGNPSRRWLAAVMIFIWATRLSFHLFARWQRSPEDERYRELKKKWGKQAQARMFRFYQFQAMGSFLFSIPVFLAANNQTDLGWLDLVGVAVFLVAVVGEAVADSQLASFKRDPENQGKVCKEGLWGYTRHPNYFFEWLHWFSYAFLAITAYLGWLSLLAPAAMYYFLTQKTGIPTTEEQSVRSRGDAYREYQQTTNAFFPGPQKRKQT